MATAYNFNEINITENGFLNEFRLAQQNLQANIAAGRGAHFRYAGPGTGTAPLPIFLAYFSGLRGTGAGNAANYSSTLFANNTFLNPLAALNPQPYAAATRSTRTRRGARTRCAPACPRTSSSPTPICCGGANVTTTAARRAIDAMVLSCGAACRSGLQFETNYTYGQGTEQTGLRSVSRGRTSARHRRAKARSSTR